MAKDEKADAETIEALLLDYIQKFGLTEAARHHFFQKQTVVGSSNKAEPRPLGEPRADNQ